MVGNLPSEKLQVGADVENNLTFIQVLNDFENVPVGHENPESFKLVAVQSSAKRLILSF